MHCFPLYNVISKYWNSSLLFIDKVDNMEVSYKRLWKLLIDKDMKKKDLVKAAHISTYTINKLNRGDNVNTDTLVKICSALQCSIEDIMEVIPHSKNK